MSTDNYMQFARIWLNAPLRTGAIAPSFRNLARHMAFAAAPQPDSLIVELGAGTGVVTQVLLELGVQEKNLTLVESNKNFSCILKKRFPKATIITEDAFVTIGTLLSNRQTISSVVSSLPLLVYRKEKRQDLCRQALSLVGPYGRLVQFTYAPVSPISITDDIYAVSSRRIWSNMPPAVVWTYQAIQKLCKTNEG